MNRRAGVFILFLWAYMLISYAPDAAHPPEIGLALAHVILAVMLTAGAWAALAGN